MDAQIQRFRAMMARLDPTISVLRQAESAIWVPDPGGFASQLAARLELRPASSHLVLGGIGSGKTVQLIQAMARLSKLADASVDYIDLPLLFRGSPGPGSLLLAALANIVHSQAVEGVPGIGGLRTSTSHGGAAAFCILNGIANMALGSVPSALASDQLSTLRALTHLLPIAREGARHSILFIDSLDRLVSPTATFQGIVEQDVMALQSLGYGLAVVGPPQLRLGFPEIRARFDRIHSAATRDTTALSTRAFLRTVVRARAPEDFISDEVCDRISEWSGGMLRDHLLLAQSAAEEAYVNGATAVSGLHVDAAADALGRKLMFGLTETQLRTLMFVRLGMPFEPTSQADVELITSNRLLEMTVDGKTVFNVHPTIAPFVLGSST